MYFKFSNKFFIILIILSLIYSFIYFPASYSEDELYVWSPQESTINTSSPIVQEPKEDNFLSLQSESAILIEQNSGQILYSHHIHEKLKPASVTKVMSILLIMESVDSGFLKLSDQVPCSLNAASMGGSQIWLDPRESLTVEDMLKAICVNSANDCVVAMAEKIAGSEEAFVELMNNKAKKLGMTDTNFKNCHGLDEEGHETSAYDISVMSRELLINHPSITKYTTIWTDSLRNGKSQLSNTNKLIKNYPGATGLKTGSTSLALYNLSASATRNNLSLIAVVMKAPTTKIRFEEAKKLLDYGFNTFEYKSFFNKNDIFRKIKVEKGTQDSIDIVFKNSASALIKKGTDKDLEVKIELPESIKAPLHKEQQIGLYNIYEKDTLISSTPLIISEQINQTSYISLLRNLIFKSINFLHIDLIKRTH